MQPDLGNRGRRGGSGRQGRAHPLRIAHAQPCQPALDNLRDIVIVQEPGFGHEVFDQRTKNDGRGAGSLRGSQRGAQGLAAKSLKNNEE